MIVFGARDAGPAAYLARVVGVVPEPYQIIASSISLPVFEMHGLSAVSEFCFDGELPALIVVGTCLGDGVDKELIRFGKKNEIPTISIIEHWTWMYERFEIGGGLLLPDMIWVNDVIAKSAAISAGIPEEVITIVGNPVLEEADPICHRDVANEEERKSRNCREIVFISESLENSFPKGGECYLGFDEYEVLADLVSILTESDHLIVKLHPEESREKFDMVVSSANCKVTMMNRCDVRVLVESADYLIGMGSMLLLEIAKVRTDVISYRPGELMSFIGNDLGVTHHIGNMRDLNSVLGGKISIKNQLVGDRFAGSLKRINCFIDELNI